MKAKKKKSSKIGLALGSGGAKGLAHIGVLDVLEQNNVKIGIISGSSIGALVGAFYAYFGQIEKIKEIIEETNWKKIVSLLLDPSLKGGLIRGEKIKKFIEHYLGNISFKDLKIPLIIVATNLEDGKAVFLDRGSVVEAIMASISIPLVFQPVEIGGKMLLDGGLSVPVPVEILKKKGADIVIAVNLYKQHKISLFKSKAASFFRIGQDSLNILLYHLAGFNLKEADIVISPNVEDIGWNEFTKHKEAVDKGRKATISKMSKIKKISARSQR